MDLPGSVPHERVLVAAAVLAVLAAGSLMAHCQLMDISMWRSGDAVILRNDGPLPVTGTLVLHDGDEVLRTEQLSLPADGLRRRVHPDMDRATFHPRACPHRTVTP